MCYNRPITGIRPSQAPVAERLGKALLLAAQEQYVNQQSQPTADHSASPPDADPRARESAAELDRFGIVQVPVMTYEWGGYRYSNASDALAAARRDAR